MTWGIMAMDKFANTDLHYLDFFVAILTFSTFFLQQCFPSIFSRIYMIVYIIKHYIILIY